MADPIAPAPAVGAPAAASPAKAPTVVVKPGAPASAPVAPVKPTPSPHEVELKKAQIARKTVELEKRQLIAAQGKWKEEQKTFGAKLSEYESFKKLISNAKTDPVPLFQAAFGDDWQEAVMEAKVHGTDPVKLMRATEARLREEFEAKETARQEASKRESTEAQQRALTDARRQLNAEAAAFWKENGAGYEGLEEEFGGVDNIAAAIAQRIEQEYRKSEVRDDNGNTVQPGRVLSVKEAADLIEGQIEALALRLASKAKYAEKFRAKLSPAPTQNTAPSGMRMQPTPRKTLSNDLTGSTPSKAPPLNDKDRMERVIAAEAAVRAKRQH